MYPNLVNPQAGIFVHNQCKALQSIGIEVKVISPTPSFPGYPKWRGYKAMKEVTEYEGISVTYVPTRMFPKGFFFGSYSHFYQQALKPILAQTKADCIHAHTLFPDGHAIVRLANEQSLPVVVTAHGSDVMLYPNRNPRVKLKTIETLEQSDQVITVSHRLEKVARSFAETAKLKTIYNGFSANQFSPGDRQEARKELGLSLDQGNLLFIGNLYPVKGVSDLLQAFRQAASKAPDLQLHLVGDGPLRASLEAETKRLQLEHRVTFHGRQPYEKMVTWMRSADAIVLSSLSEGLPSVLLESMACGIPMIATDVGGIAEILQNGKTGSLVPPQDVTKLAKVIEQWFTTDESLRKQYGEAAYQASYQYTWESNATQMFDVYKEVIAQKK